LGTPGLEFQMIPPDNCGWFDNQKSNEAALHVAAAARSIYGRNSQW